MAPDLNTLPASPGAVGHGHSSSTSSRRASQMTGTPLLPGVQSSGFAQQDDVGVPMRHPRPLTAAELHLELEKEQEAVVNRLARELSALRAQHSASVASNTSSTHSSAIDPTPATSATSDMAPPPPPTSNRQHRSSSSSINTRSVPSHPATPALVASQASVDRARDAVGLRSRDNSLVSGVGPAGTGVAGVTMPAPSRSRAPSAGPSPGLSGEQFLIGGGRLRRESNASLSGRMEEMERARAQLEIARKENEMLIARVRELEAALKEKGKDGK